MCVNGNTTCETATTPSNKAYFSILLKNKTSAFDEFEFATSPETVDSFLFW